MSQPSNQLIAGDTAAQIVVTITDSSTLLPVDLTGKTCFLRFRIGPAPLIASQMTVATPATDGKVSYVFTTGQLTPGQMRAQVAMVDSDGKVLTTSPFGITVVNPVQ